MISLICHDITTDNYTKTMFWIRTCQINAPDSRLQMILTKVDKLSPQERSSKKEAFVKEITDLLQKEIMTAQMNMKATKSQAKKEVYQKQVKNYNDLKDQIGKYAFLEVSCVPGWEESVGAVTTCLLQFAEDQKHLVMLRPIEKELFVKIGKLGIKEHIVQPEISAMNESMSSRMNEVKEGSRFHAVSDQEGLKEDVMEIDGNMDGQSLMIEDTAEETQSVHTNIQGNIQGAYTMAPKFQTMQQQYLELSEVAKEFKPIYREYYPHGKDEEMNKELEKCLRNLKERGLLRHFTGDKELENIIFHDISTLVSILRIVFWLDVKTTLTYQADTCYKSKHHFERDAKNLADHGILSMEMLSHLLERSNCSLPASVVAKLLSSLDVGIIVRDEVDQQCCIFIPYFLENIQAPQDVEE